MSIWLFPLAVVSIVGAVSAAQGIYKSCAGPDEVLYAGLMSGGFLVPGALAIGTGSTLKVVDVFGQTRTIVRSVYGVTPQSVTVSMIAVLLVLTVVWMRELGMNATRVPGQMFLFLGIFIIGAASSSVTVATPLLTARQILLLLAVVALLVGHQIRSGLGEALLRCSVLVVCAQGAFAAIRPSLGTAPCGENKCTLAGFAVTGLSANGNALGLFSALALGGVLAFLRGRERWLSGSALFYITTLSGSRTGLVASTVVVAFAILPALKRWGTAAVILLSASSAVLPMIRWDGDAFGLRGYMWQVARGAVASRPVFGSGWNGLEATLSAAGSTDGLSFYSVHNSALDLLYVAGGVGLALGLACWIYLVYGSARLGLSLYLIPVAVSGHLERPWNLWTFDLFSWSLLLAGAVGLTYATLQSGSALQSSRPEIDASRVGVG